ncbi:hypothetical protein LJC37_00600 [Bacteroidales bacterium OttesenSCG-928-E04]|nr:hypothetical protein [Bacteroidales bacterium OttesenSCG-928-E04]
MKTLKFFPFIILLIFIACHDNTQEMLTVVHPNGSIYRELVASADSTFMMGDTSDNHNPFAIVKNEDWQIFWQYDSCVPQSHFPISEEEYRRISKADSSTNAKEFYVKICRNFSSVDELSEQFKLKPQHSWADVDVEYSFAKKFRLFYTYYYYSETYPRIENSFPIPIESVMEKDEAAFWFTGTPDLTRGMNGVEMAALTSRLEQQYDRWLTTNLWEMRYEVLLDNFDSLPQGVVTKDELRMMKDTILAVNIEQLLDIDMEECLNDFFQTDIFSVLWDNASSPMSEFENGFLNNDFVAMQLNAFVYKLVMPGKIVNTNGAQMDDTLQWNLTSLRFSEDAYVIMAESRKLNYWMFAIVGGLLVLGITGVVLKGIRKK